MANFLENMLSGGAVKRQDTKRLAITKRPLPERPRQMLELFGAMGNTATVQGLMRGLEVDDADPHQVMFIMLGRWPTQAEAAAMTAPMKLILRIQALLRSEEFRAHLVRRTCEAFAERKRLLFVRIPRSGGQHVLDVLDARHPLLPLDLTATRFHDLPLLVQTLGHVFGRVLSSNTLAIAHTRMAAFMDQGGGKMRGGDGLAWYATSPPCRVGDTLFTVLRNPQARALGQVNALLCGWQSGERMLPAAMRARMDGAGRRAKTADWRQLGRDILAETILDNPICHALGDGTMEGALAACGVSPIQLVQLEQFRQWSRSVLNNIDATAAEASEPILRPGDLRAAEAEAMAAATAQDQLFHERFMRRIKETGLPEVRGREM